MHRVRDARTRQTGRGCICRQPICWEWLWARRSRISNCSPVATSTSNWVGRARGPEVVLGSPWRSATSSWVSSTPAGVLASATFEMALPMIACMKVLRPGCAGSLKTISGSLLNALMTWYTVYANAVANVYPRPYRCLSLSPRLVGIRLDCHRLHRNLSLLHQRHEIACDWCTSRFSSSS